MVPSGSTRGQLVFRAASIHKALQISGCPGLQLNAWVLAYRRAAGDAFLSWEGETHIEPPREARAQQGVLRGGDYWSAERLRDPRARRLRPDAVLEVACDDTDRRRVFFIEFDRTRRVDKNY